MKRKKTYGQKKTIKSIFDTLVDSITTIFYFYDRDFNLNTINF
ncbi:hypothetical protein FTN78_p100006 (plasmid) [Lactococcus lactis subsp. lactis bv. diacetylactis]|nr:hypothetical protein FTN78_p100006 [Lactococcus lactis subsp. lactis bv. diacetylactis]